MPSPPIQPSPPARIFLVPSTVWSVLWVIGRHIIFVGFSVCCVFFGVYFSRFWTLVWAILVRVRVVPWRLFVLICGVLHIWAFGELSLNDIRWTIFARVRVWKFYVLPITIGMICICSLRVCVFMMACLRCSYMVCMSFMMSSALLLVEYLLQSMSCRHHLLLYVVSSTRCPR